jgi:hypothetical protein
MVTTDTAGASTANEDRAHDTARHLYDAECALHVAHQTHVDAWITTASDRLHQAVADHLAAVAERDAGCRPLMPNSTPTRHREDPANHSTKEQQLMTTSLTAWPNTRDVSPPTDHLYRSATWLLGRHPRLALLAARISGVVVIEDDELAVDLDHLADVLSAARPYTAAWEDYEYRHRPPEGDDAYEIWRQAGPKADSFADGLSDFLVMSSGELAALRLLATLATTSSVPPFGVDHIRSLDEEGQRLVDDWCAVVRAY